MAIQMSISLSILMFLILFRPKSTASSNNKEIVNEITFIFMGYFVLSFTGAEPDPVKRAVLGRCLVCISSSNIALHLVSLIIDSVKKVISSLRMAAKKYCCKTKRQRPLVQELYVEPQDRVNPFEND